MSEDIQKDWYAYQEKLYLAVDCIIFGFVAGKLKVLAFRRKVEPLKGEWSLIGSFVKESETVGDAASRVLVELTGLSDVYLKELNTYSAIDRDPGDRCVSIAHYALINLEQENEQQVASYDAHWFGIDEVPALVLDHDFMFQDALQALKREARQRPIGFELLSERFTIPQLQSLYEAIFETELDPRNFRKKMISTGLLLKTDEKDYSSSKKGAFLYSFDPSNYERLSSTNYDSIF